MADTIKTGTTLIEEGAEIQIGSLRATTLLTETHTPAEQAASIHRA